jgi:hypothetical protein
VGARARGPRIGDFPRSSTRVIFHTGAGRPGGAAAAPVRSFHTSHWRIAMRDSSDEPRRTLGARQTRNPEAESKQADSRIDRPQDGLRRLGVELAASAGRSGTSPTPSPEQEVTPKTVEAFLGDQSVAAIHSSTEHAIAGSGHPAMRPAESVNVGELEAGQAAEARANGIAVPADGSGPSPTGLDGAISSFRVVEVNPPDQQQLGRPALARQPTRPTNDLNAESEYQRLRSALRPVLDAAPLRRLQAPQLQALAADSAVPAEKVQMFAAADRLSQGDDESNVRLVPAPEPLPAPIWYAWLRAGIGSDADAVLTQPVERLTAAVHSAIDANVIPAEFGNRLDQIAGLIAEHRAEHLLDRRLTPGASPLRAVLATMAEPLDARSQRAAAVVLSEVRPPTDKLTTSLRSAGLTEPQADAVARTIRLGELTSYHAPLLGALQPIVKADTDPALPSLARLGPDTLLDLAYQHGIPEENTPGWASGALPGTEQAFAREVQARIQAQHSTLTLTARLRDRSLALALPEPDRLASFLTEHPDFDVTSTPIQQYLAEQGLDGGQDGSELARSLSTLRRVDTLTRTWDDAAALLDAEFHSALDIVGKRVDTVAELLGGMVEDAEVVAIYDRATALRDAATAVLVSLPQFSSADVPVIPSNTPSPELLSKYPTLQSLFGSLESCACGHCRSVLGPTAYLVDLLEFLRKEACPAFNELMRRRPDLADLELSCENTQHELPSIDLALEVLENTTAFDPPLVVELPTGVDPTTALTSDPLPAAILDVLCRTASEIGPQLKATREPQQLPPIGTTAWTVTDRWRRWTLHHAEQAFLVTTRWRGTRGPKPVSSGLDLAAVVEELDQQAVSAELEAALRPLVTTDPLTQQSLRVLRVEVDEPSRRWRVTYLMQATVFVSTPRGDIGTIALTSTGGTPLVSREYSAAAVAATSTALANGEAGGMLSSLLRASDTLEVADDPASGGHLLTSPVPVVLELAYAPARLTLGALAYQSAHEDADLLASPQNRNPEAYGRLRDAAFPWSLPFDLPLEEVRAYLERAGYPRPTLQRLWLGRDAASSPQLAYETLGTSPAEVARITTPLAEPAEPGLWPAWGLHVDAAGLVSLWDSAAGQDRRGAPTEVLAWVSVLLQQSGLVLEELVDILATRFVAGQGPTPAIVPDVGCRPDEMRLKQPSAGLLDRLRRFVLLTRRLGWSVADVDIALTALQATSTITGDTIVQFAEVEQIRQRLGLTVPEIVSWFGGIGTATYTEHDGDGVRELPSLYERLFLLPPPPAVADRDFILNASRSMLAVEDPPQAGGLITLAQKTGELAAALGVKAEDLDLLVASLPTATSAPPPPATSQPLTLAALNQLSRRAGLARALRLSVEDYLRSVRITGLDPLASPSATVEFLQAVDTLRQNPFKLAELDYLFCHGSDTGVSFALDDAMVVGILAGVRSAVRGATGELTGEGVDVEAALRRGLAAEGWYPTLVDSVLANLAGTAGRGWLESVLRWATLPETSADLGMAGDAPAIPDRLRGRCWVESPPGAASRYLVLKGWLDETDQAALKKAWNGTHAGLVSRLLSVLAGLPAPAAADQLADQQEIAQVLAPTSPVGDRYRAVLSWVVRHRRLTACAAALDQLLGFPAGTAALLLLELLADPGSSSTRPAVHAFLDAAFADGACQLGVTEFPAQASLVRRLGKVAVLCQRFQLDAAQLGWFASSGPVQRTRVPGLLGVDVNTLPINPTNQPKGEQFLSFRRLAAFVALRDRSQGMTALLGRYVDALRTGGASEQERVTAAMGVLADGLGVPSATMTAAAAQLFADDLAGDTVNARDPLQIFAAIDLITALTRLGATPDQIPPLTGLGPGGSDASAGASIAQSLLRSRYGDAEWTEVIKPVADALRARQRDALVAHLVHRYSLRGPDDLYQFLLIDVLTAPCATTTRLMAATAAVQLLAHRSLLGLEEPRVPAASIDPDRWDWMKTYRVWEANRNVFLYPQNWLYPELRDDATQAFRSGESSLSQAEPSSTTGTAALAGYLDNLVELSRIQVLGMYQHRRSLRLADPLGRTELWDLYLVGRTPDEPHRYFWRVCEDFGAIGQHWRGWERLDLDITGTHVLPFVLSGDLYLAWPLLQRKDAADAAKPSDTDDWELKFAWSWRGRDGWAEKKVGPAFGGELKTLKGRDERQAFTFRADVTTDTPLGTNATGLDLGAARQSARLTCLVVNETVVGATSLTPRPDDASVSDKGSVELALHFTARVLWESSKSPNLYWPAKGAKVYLEAGNSTSGITQIGFTANAQGEARQHYFHSMERGAESGDVWLKRLKTSNSMRAFAAEQGVKNSPVKTWPLKTTIQGNEVDTRLYSAKTWVIDLILQWDGEVPPDVTGETRSYSTATTKTRFEINADRGAEWGTTPGFTLNALPGTGFLNNGFSATGKAVVRLPGDRTLGTAPGDGVLVPANPSGSSAWHYNDEESAYVLNLVGETDWALLSDGFPVARDLHLLAHEDARPMYAPQVQQATDEGRALQRLTPTPAPFMGQPGSISGGSSTAQGIVFDLANPSSPYYWELFLHLPLLVAQTLCQEQRFDEAQWWLNLIFDPTTPAIGSDGRDREYWRFAPFRAAGRPDRIEDLLAWLANPFDTHQQTQAFARQIDAWLRNPFRPHEVARLRLGAYQWNTLFSYLDTLLEAGDARFRRDTRESLVEATMLFVLAATLLGPRPTVTAPPRTPPPLSYRSVTGNWDRLSNTWVTVLDSELVRQLMAWLQWLRRHGTTGPSGIPSDISALGNLGMTYFCVPPNPKLLDYWDRVEDRLFKLRHCQNIEGITRDLPLFEPPIDPGLLVRAVAAGLDIDQVLDDLQGPVSQYRYGVLAQRANELVAEVKALGGALLAALEKKDAERLARVRAGQEVALLTLIKDVRTQQSSEAQANIDALGESRKSAVARWKHFTQLVRGQVPADPAEGTTILDVPSNLPLAAASELDADVTGLGLLTSETHQLQWLNVANNYTIASGIFNAVAVLQYLSGTTEFTKALVGFGHASNSVASLLAALASNANHQAGRNAILAGHQRRRDDWIFQINTAAHEIQQTDKQLAAARIRKAIADKELSNHQTQIDHAQDIEDLLRDKYTNERLYTWLSGQLARTYFSTYQLALDMARQAERAFRYELAQPGARFIEPRYWDSLHKGLLAGEQLALDLKRMDAAYLNGNLREQEMTCRVSLLRLDPVALVKLRATGACEFRLPEMKWDADAPGMYLRRLKSVAVSLPCVAGPYSTLHARLTLLSSCVRHRPDVPTTNPGANYPRKPPGEDDSRFTEDYGLAESIMTSGPVEASGLWEVNLHDERRLPFEGRGAISRWRLELPGEFQPIDYQHIADVVMDVRYSARYGGDRLRDAATEALKTAAATASEIPQALLVGLRDEYPTEWARLTATDDRERTQEFRISRDRFPYLFRNFKDLTIHAVDVYAGTNQPTDTDLPVVLPPTDDGVSFGTSCIGELHHASRAGLTVAAQAESVWKVRASAAAASKLADLVLVLSFTAQTPKDN